MPTETNQSGASSAKKIGVKIGSSDINFSKVIIIGEIFKVIRKPSGGALIWIISGNNEETRMDTRNPEDRTYFTPVVVVRMPRAVVESTQDMDRIVNGAIVSIEGRMQGIKKIDRTHDREYITNEVVVGSARLLDGRPDDHVD